MNAIGSKSIAAIANPLQKFRNRNEQKWSCQLRLLYQQRPNDKCAGTDLTSHLLAWQMLLETVQYSIRKSSPATQVSHCTVRKNCCCLFTELFSYAGLVIWQSHTWSAFMSLQNLNNVLVSARERGRRRMSVPNERMELALGLLHPLGVFTSERKQLPSKVGDGKLRHRDITRFTEESFTPRYQDLVHLLKRRWPAMTAGP